MTVEEILNKFNNEDDEVIMLTPTEEVVILHELINQSPIDAGSSRAAYEFYDKYVVKVALTQEGKNQNENEYMHYTEYDNEYFARLYAHGETINIMEYVSEAFYFEEDEYDEDDDSNDVEAWRDLVSNLDEIIGDTIGDNGQIGWSSDRQRWVCYDYGYAANADRDDLVAAMDSWFEDLESIPMLAIISIITGHTYEYSEINKLVYALGEGEISHYAFNEDGELEG